VKKHIAYGGPSVTQADGGGTFAEPLAQAKVVMLGHVIVVLYGSPFLLTNT
jgi:hypothetical protein